MGIQVVAHTSFLGHTGYNNHSRNFFTHLNKYIPTRVRNYTGCKDLSYLKPEEHNLIIQQNLDGHPMPVGLPFTPNPNDLQVNIVLNESHHYFFYDKYEHPMIAYNVWESTKQLPEYFNRILEYDQFWCPTEWQRQCTIDQGYPEDRVKVVHEAVNGNIFLPGVSSKEKHDLYDKYKIPHDAYVCMIFGRWDYRKSTEEMIRAWVNVFGKNDKCYLVLSADNPFSSDGLKTTEERLKHYKLEHKRIKVLHFPPRDEYVKWMQYGSCLLSCSRSEGWNLPLMEALACGTPSICSDWGGHLEFADGIAYKVQVPKELPPRQVYMLGDNHDLGVWGEPDFYNLEYMMGYVYDTYDQAKSTTLALSKHLRRYFTWDHAARQAEEHINDLVKTKYHYVENKQTPTKPKVSFVTTFYNAEKYIDDLYPSVLNQTFKDWEWIITDDFSDDNTKELIKAICKLDPRVKYVNQREKQEVYWNPHKYASGDYILTIDADDQLFPKTAEIIAHFFDENPDINCIHTNANYHLEDFSKGSFKNSSFCRFDKYKTVLEKHPAYLFNESGYERVGFMFGVIRAYRNPGPYFNFNDGDFKLGRHEDLVKLVRLEEMGTPLFLNRTLYKVRMHEDSNSGSWGDKGGETEFEKIYETAGYRRKHVYEHDQRYEPAREELYAFLYSELNEETARKKVCCIGFKHEKEIREIYYDHDIIWDAFDTAADYVFVYMGDKTNITEEFIKELQEIPSADVLIFMKNDDWEPGFYELEDGSNYFEAFNNVQNELKKHTTFTYGTYLYKYCFMKFTTPERKLVKINLGCGNDIRKGYINVDKYNNTGNVDYQWDLAKLEVPDNSIDEIYTSHVFEHIMINDVYATLEEWERALRPGGKIVMRLPNLETEVKIWLETPDDKKWFEVHRIFGSQSHEGNTHFSGHNPESLKSLIERFNFKVTHLGVGNRGFGEEIQLTAEKIEAVPIQPAQYITHYVDGPFAEVRGDGNDKGFYICDFLDPDNNSSAHQQMMGINTWTRPHRRYYTNWLIRISRNGKVVHEHPIDLKGKNVLISIDTKSMGDNIAWMPYINEFRKKYQCNVWASTFWNMFFEDAEEYKDIHFVTPGQVVDNLYASYKIGCYDNDWHKNKNNWRAVPLQQVASDMLGLDYKEIVPSIGMDIGKRPIKEKYVTISEFSTFQCKFWNYPNAWQTIIDYLIDELGYKVAVVSKEETKLKRVVNWTNRPITQTVKNIAHADFHMGVSAGPTWLAWALKVPTILISGYSAKWGEYTTNVERVINEDVCTGCFNDPQAPFDRGDWNWCPRLKGTDRQHECSKSITPQMVIDAINRIVKKS